MAIDLINENSEELSLKRYGPRSDSKVRFHENLMKTYLKSLRKTVEDQGIHHVDYPLIRNKGVEGLEWRIELDKYPIIHVVKGSEETVDEFKFLVRSLNSEDSYKFISDYEAPPKL